ncbi:hypothetical protein KPH14_000974 [Odynerus spinipes]|uniref:Retrovirus-related Pol polyprotein from transposon TNT 1-94-like beta-barrel domain-containing protein n=1 Tax=Odynerus spinipes TaxID=1348599 RepID=A0AAD9RET3_9HYME|nr:hypothetical protein KPH14_000974 [Odynerus spinipes]
MFKGEKAYRATGERNREQNYNSGCYVCDRRNHKASHCYYRNERNTNNNNHDKNGNQETRRYPKQRQSQMKKYNFNRKEHASVAVADKTEFSLAVTKNCQPERDKGERSWTIDSGSTSHMTPYRYWLVNSEPYNIEVNLAEENRSLQSHLKGDVLFKTWTKDGTRNVRIKDVLYVPNLRTNLMSVSQMVANGHKVIFDSGEVEIISKEGILIGTALDEGGVYILQVANNNQGAAPPGPPWRKSFAFSH